MNQPPVIPAQPNRDFRRKRPSWQARLRSVSGKIGVIALALAIPALAANDGFDVFGAEVPIPETEPMPFEIPGQSFPGSAFYYLEDTPQLVETESDGIVEVIGSRFERSDRDIAEAPLAASPLRIVGSDRDHLRAQQCLAQAIYYEAASESDAGQRAVAQVVLNRVAHPAYPRSVCGVVYQGSERTTGCQFTFTCDGSLARRPSQASWNRASRHARESLAGIVYAPVGTATHYHTLAVNPYWASSLDTVGVIGAHIFYRWKGKAGRPAAFTARYSGSEPAPSRARSVTPAAPDPIAIPSNFVEIETPPAQTRPAAPAAAVENSVSPADNLPRSGSVREEYANSGRWIERP